MLSAKSVIVYAAITLSTLILSCANGVPELNPYEEASSAPGVVWKPSEKELMAAFHTEELPSIPEDLKSESKSFTLSQLVDVALVNNPTTRVAWEDTRAAAAWAEARGLYYPQIGGAAQGATPFKGQYSDVGLSLNYLLFDFGGREAKIDAARLALIIANWNQNWAIQNVLQTVAVSFYNVIGDVLYVDGGMMLYPGFRTGG